MTDEMAREMARGNTMPVAEFVDTRRYREVELSSEDGRNWLVRDVVSGKFVGGGNATFDGEGDAREYASQLNVRDAA